MDLANRPHDRGIFIATVNAVMKVGGPVQRHGTLPDRRAGAVRAGYAGVSPRQLPPRKATSH